MQPGMHRFLFFLLIVSTAFLLVECATPTQPSGGPADRTPPEVVETDPPSGTTMFDGDRITFQFSKYVDRDSFREAFQMEPDVNIEYDISFRRRSVRVTFEDPLPDTTTIIFTLGTDLSDTRNNRINSPYQLAISTGPDIDEGKITARVRDAGTGEGKRGERVVLYRYPVDLETGADYVAQADSAGVVSFNYLREGKYKAFWLDDRNRNRRWDRDREDAQPFRTDTIGLGRADELDIGTVFVTREDTIPPRLQGVGMLSEVRLRLRFSEEVMIEDDALLEITDTGGQFITDAIPLYVDEQDQGIILAQSPEPLPDGVSYKLQMQGITDLAGNTAESDVEEFPGSDEADTTFARYIGNDTRHGITPDEPLVFRYARLLDDSPDVLDSLIVVESQTTHSPWPHAEIRDNLLFVYPDGEWSSSESYEIRVWDEADMSRRTIQPQIHYEDDMGGMNVIIEEDENGEIEKDTLTYRVRIIDERGHVVRDEEMTGEREFEKLPPGNYVVKVFEIRDDSRNWDPGRVDPFRKPALYFIQEDVPVERGLTGQVYVEF